MGCGVNKAPRVTVNFQKYQINDTSKSYLNRINGNTWMKIVDYLNYQELREVGKTNKMFNYIAKQNDVLIKFFKKKQTQPKNIKIDSFAILQKNDKKNSIISIYSTSEEGKLV